MCIGTPVQVLDPDPSGVFAWCASGEDRYRIDTQLVGCVPAGTWLLEFNGAARRVLTAQEAALTLRSLDALRAVLASPHDAKVVDAAFADLVGREPQLPEHLRK